MSIMKVLDGRDPDQAKPAAESLAARRRVWAEEVLTPRSDEGLDLDPAPKHDGEFEGIIPVSAQAVSENLGNELHREATSRIKDFALSPGHNIAL